MTNGNHTKSLHKNNSVWCETQKNQPKNANMEYKKDERKKKSKSNNHKYILQKA